MQLCWCKQRESLIIQKSSSISWTLFSKVFKTFSIPNNLLQFVCGQDWWTGVSRYVLRTAEKWWTLNVIFFRGRKNLFNFDWKININFSNWRIKWGQMSGKIGCFAKSPSRVKTDRKPYQFQCVQKSRMLRISNKKENKWIWISKNHSEIYCHSLELTNNEFQESECTFESCFQRALFLLLMMMTAFPPNQLCASFYTSELSLCLNSWRGCGCGDSK